jgi:hypothetical protein
MKKSTILMLTAIIALGVFAYVKTKKKPFTEMTDSEKKATVEADAKKREDIKNDSTLTQQEKIEAEEKMNKELASSLTEAEKQAMIDFNMKNIMNGSTQVKDAGLPSYLSGINL